MRHFEQAERRRRLLVRHHLAAPGLTVEQVAGDLVGLHSSDPATVVLSVRARLEPFAVADLEDAMYERRTLVRMLAMRRTMFVVPVDLAAVLDASCTKALVAGERRRLVQLLEGAGVTADPADTDAWIDDVREKTLATLRANDPLPASRLTKVVPELALQFRVSVGKNYETSIGVSTRMLFLLAAAGDVVRTRPLGSWLSSQYRWTTTEQWIGPLPPMDPAAARAELVRRWLTTYGPGTTEDIAWWTKWTKAQVRAALDAVDAVEVSVDTGDDDKVAGWALAGDLDDTPADPDGLEPVSLLPSLDPTVMGWKHRGWYLGPHAGPLFDRNGNAGPTVWVGGHAVGTWSQREGGEVVTRLLEPVDVQTTERLAAEAARMTAWMDGVRVTPRFTTPLERELARR